MRIIRFKDPEGKICIGCDYDGKDTTPIKGDLFGTFEAAPGRIRVAELMAPVAPAAILCIGLNYRAHAEETGMELPKHPVLFMKNPGSVTGPDSDIEIPQSCLEKPEVDFEVELAVVMGKKGKNIKKEEALSHVLGYTCANDISARRWQKHSGGGQWVRGKSFDTFCPMGPALVTADEIPDPQALQLESVLNGETMQKSSTSDMIFTVAELIARLSLSTTLLPGTVILTGTPSGVGFTRNPPVFLKPGDILETRVEKLGRLTNQVTAEPL